MRVLGIDSSGMVAGVAIADEEHLVAEYNVNYKKTHSQTLLPMLDEIVKMTELDLNTIDIFAVAAGPGSFTGLRIGSATAKGLGLALKKPLVSVPTLEGLAYNCCGTQRLVCPMLDARRNQVFTGLYEFDGTILRTVEGQMAIPVAEIIEKINHLGREVLVLGDGVPVCRQQLEEELQVPYLIAPAHMNRQRAGSIAVLGMQYAKAGRTETAMEHHPDYLRLSQAERERAEREREKR